jgi:hypothetical protein
VISASEIKRVVPKISNAFRKPAALRKVGGSY